MKKNIGTVVFAASMLVATSAFAEKGKWEISIAGNIDDQTQDISAPGGFTSSSDSTSTFVNLDIGRYFTSKLVGRVSLSLSGNESTGSSTTGTTVGVGLKYYFGEAAKSSLVPFVQGGLNGVFFESTSGGTSSDFFGVGVLGGGGLSYFISEDVSADLSLQVYANTLTGDLVDMDQSGTRLLFGLTARY